MTDEKGSDKGMGNDQEIFNDLANHPFIERLMEIMRSGSYLMPPGIIPVQDDDTYFRDLTSVEKAIMTLVVEDIVSPEMGAALFWGGVKESEDYKKADSETENRGMIIRKDWKIVFLLLLTEEEHHEKMKRAVDSLLESFLSTGDGGLCEVHVLGRGRVPGKILRELNQAGMDQSSLFQRMFGRG